MAEYRIPYGKGSLSFSLPDDLPTDLLAPAPVEVTPDPVAAVEHALSHPVAGPRLEEWKDVRSVAGTSPSIKRKLPLQSSSTRAITTLY